MAIRWDKFTVKSQEAVQAATNLALEHGNPELTPMHMLAALLEDKDGIIVPVLQKVGVPTEQLLARARHDRTGAATPVAVDDVVAQQVEEWQPIFQRDGRRVEVTGERGLIAIVTLAGLSQIIATLLDNSLVHGAGTVTLCTKLTAGSVVVEIGDEGPGVPPELERKVFNRSVSSGEGTGLGLYLARSLVAVDGGRLELVRARPAVFAIFLREASEVRAAGERLVIGPA